MKALFLLITILFFVRMPGLHAELKVAVWDKLELKFKSQKEFDDPLDEIKQFRAVFTAPSGREKFVDGFWDGGTEFKVRFKPDEMGTWRWETLCSNVDAGLAAKGQFLCIENKKGLALYQNGGIIHRKGSYHLSHANGTPYFWLACTAWNGALKSTDEEWSTYLKQRANNNYNTIQYVTTQWRGCDKNAEGLKAFKGRRKIIINPEFFRRIDKKTDEINQHGLLAAPVLLWALPFGAGVKLSPGAMLPESEAIRLARYIIARLQGNHVVWMLGGDGVYAKKEYQQRWLNIARGTFKELSHAVTTMHPCARSFVGKLYEKEEWYSLMGYQSSHSNAPVTIDWINKGPVSKQWMSLRPMPYINLEPCYEEIAQVIEASDVRNASWWSLFSAPIAGVSYGANGIWPWIRNGETLLNHGNSIRLKTASDWEKSMNFPASLQMKHLYNFIQRLDWWEFFPAGNLLAHQPGNHRAERFISVMAKNDYSQILVYLPLPSVASLKLKGDYRGIYYDPVTGEENEAEAKINQGVTQFHQFFPGDRVLYLIRQLPKGKTGK